MDIPSIKNHLEINKGAFTILYTNIACLNAKFDELSIFIQDLKQNGLFFSAICLQESLSCRKMMIFLCTNLMVIPVFPKVENVALKEDWLFIYIKNLHTQLLHFMNDPTFGKVNLYKFLEMNCHINYYSVMCTDL